MPSPIAASRDLNNNTASEFNMDFNLNDEQRQIYEYGAQLAQRFDNAYCPSPSR